MPDNPLFHMKLKFVFGMVIFGFVAFGSFALFHIYEKQQVTSASEINMAGRQRMLSQRLAFLGMEIDVSSPGKEREQLLAEFRASLHLFKKNHKSLSQGDPQRGISPPRSDKLKELYFHPSRGVDPLLTHYTQKAEQLLKQHSANFPSSDVEANHNHFREFASLASASFLQHLDQVVTQYQLDAEKRLSTFYVISIAFLLISMALVLFTWLAIFRPLIEGIDSYIHQLKTQAHELKQAKIDADHANQVKASFLSSMSHELRTPLNSILGYSQLLEMRPENINEKQLVQIQQINSAGNHLLDLINEILEFARLDAGQVIIEKQSLNPTQIMQECIDLALPGANRQKINVIYDAPDALPLITADPIRLKQVTLNLLTNAVKYNRPNGKAILKAKKNCKNLRISVEDTGIGIPFDQQEHLFEPFNRLGAEKKDIEGTGVGLVIAKKLIEKMDGSIGFETVENKGSTFWIDIPLAEKN